MASEPEVIVAGGLTDANVADAWNPIQKRFLMDFRLDPGMHSVSWLLEILRGDLGALKQ